MTFVLPPIVKLAEQLLVGIELAVRGFARYHKYTYGTDIRAQAMKVATLAHRAWRDRARQLQWTERLVWAIDDLRIALQLGSQIKAFASLGQFESLARLTHQLGRQVGGWKKAQHPNGQNAAGDAPRQRAKILSSQAASHGANA
jgi:hypothetical protein